MKKITPLFTLALFFSLSTGCSDDLHYEYDYMTLNSQQMILNAQDIIADANKNISMESQKMHRMSFNSKFTVWSVPPPPGNQIQVTINGSGTATRMGKAKLTIQETITIPENDQWEAIAEVVITAANGDELHLSYTGTVDVSGTPVMAFTGACAVNGGTGAFKNAKGTLVYFGSRSWDTGSGSATFTGEISY
jgi:hypothetical protein